MRRKKKAQASVEFTILIAFGILFLSVVAAGFLTQITLLNDRLASDELLSYAQRIERNINLAIAVDTYFYHPFDLGPNDYQFLNPPNPTNFSLINSSDGTSLLFFDDMVNFYLNGNSTIFCVTKSSDSVLFTNQFVAIEDGKLLLGCMNSLTNISLSFNYNVDSSNLVNNPDYASFPIELIKTGATITINSGVPISGSFFALENLPAGTQVTSINSYNSENLNLQIA